MGRPGAARGGLGGPVRRRSHRTLEVTMDQPVGGPGVACRGARVIGPAAEWGGLPGAAALAWLALGAVLIASVLAGTWAREPGKSEATGSGPTAGIFGAWSGRADGADLRAAAGS